MFGHFAIHKINHTLLLCVLVWFAYRIYFPLCSVYISLFLCSHAVYVCCCNDSFYNIFTFFFVLLRIFLSLLFFFHISFDTVMLLNRQLNGIEYYLCGKLGFICTILNTYVFGLVEISGFWCLSALHQWFLVRGKKSEWKNKPTKFHIISIEIISIFNHLLNFYLFSTIERKSLITHSLSMFWDKKELKYIRLIAIKTPNWE